MEKGIMEPETGIMLRLEFGRYYYGGSIAACLVIDDVPAGLREEYFAGEPWADVTVNLTQGLQADEFTINHDLIDFSPQGLIRAVLDAMAEEVTPHRTIRGNYMSFPVYRIKQEIMEEVKKGEERNEECGTDPAGCPGQ